MRDFQAASPGRLRAAPLGSKIVYTAFALSALIGLFVSYRLYGAGVGDDGAATYYAGAPAAAKAAPKPAPAAPGGEPTIELAPEDAAPRALIEQIPERKLLEVTHFHLFSIPIYVLVLAHLWLLAKIPSWLQITGIVAAIASTGLHMAAPWLVRGHAGLAWLMPISGVSMGLTLGAMAIVSAIDMWLPQPPVSNALAEFRKKSAARD